MVVFVFGAESSGTRYITSLLVKLGYFGDSGHSQKVDMMGKERLEKEPKIVLRRSFPHSRLWPSIPELLEKYKGRKAKVIVTIRDWVTSVVSQCENHHVHSKKESLENIRKAYTQIFKGIVGMDFVVICLADIIGNHGEDVIRCSFGVLGIDVPKNFDFEIKKDVNEKRMRQIKGFFDV